MLEEIITYIEDNTVALIAENLIEIIISVILLVLAAFRRRIWNNARKISKATSDKLVDKIRDEVVKSFERNDMPRIFYNLKQDLKQDLEQELPNLRPPPLPRGVSGNPCPKTGLYHSQQFPREKKVFEKEEIFTEAQDLKGCYVKTFWVYEEPPPHPRF